MKHKIKFKLKIILYKIFGDGDWGLGIGDWGLFFYYLIKKNIYFKFIFF